MAKVSKNNKTVLLIALVFVAGILLIYAANSGSGSLFQGALRTQLDTNQTTTESGISRTISSEEDVREAEEGDTTELRESADTVDDYSTTISAGSDIEATAVREEEPIRQTEELEQSYTLSAGSTDVREAEDDVRLSETDSGSTVTATTTDSYSTTIDGGSTSGTQLRASAPECPAQPAMVYNSETNDDFFALLADIQNNTNCSYQFILTSPNMNETIECVAGSTSAFNDLITCNKFAHGGDLHILVRVQDGQARSSYRLENGTAVRTHQTDDFAVWKVAAS